MAWYIVRYAGSHKRAVMGSFSTQSAATEFAKEKASDTGKIMEVCYCTVRSPCDYREQVHGSVVTVHPSGAVTSYNSKAGTRRRR